MDKLLLGATFEHRASNTQRKCAVLAFAVLMKTHNKLSCFKNGLQAAHGVLAGYLFCFLYFSQDYYKCMWVQLLLRHTL